MFVQIGTHPRRRPGYLSGHANKTGNDGIQNILGQNGVWRDYLIYTNVNHNDSHSCIWHLFLAYQNRHFLQRDIIHGPRLFTTRRTRR